MSGRRKAHELATEYAERAEALVASAAEHQGSIRLGVLSEAQVWATLSLSYATMAAMYDRRLGP